MVLTLHLLRHAKSAWGNPGLDDFDRPLSDRGRREAQWIGELLRAGGFSPARIICSSAQRTRETLAAVLPALTREVSIELTRRLYEAPAERLLTVIREQLPTDDKILLVGHNPGLEDLARKLAGSGDGALRAALQEKYPPGGLAQFEFETSRWSDVGAARGRLVAFDTPPRE